MAMKSIKDGGAREQIRQFECALLARCWTCTDDKTTSAINARGDRVRIIHLRSLKELANFVSNLR